MNRTRTALVGIALAAATTVVAAPAQARTVDHWQWSEDRSFTVDTCGFATEVSDHFEGNGIARTAGGSTDGLTTSQYTTRYVAVTTNPANGKWFTLTQSSMFQERGLTDLGGGLWGYSVNQAGQPFVVSDSDGRVVLRDRGLIRFDGVYDANTDSVTSFELSGTAGPHPGFTTDLCDITRDLIG